MRKNYKEKRIQVEGRTFLIEFWEEEYGNAVLDYVCVSEILLVTKRWWGTTKTREVKRQIDKGWGANNRVKWAMDCIASHLQYEKAVIDDRQRIEDFCNSPTSI